MGVAILGVVTAIGIWKAATVAITLAQWALNAAKAFELALTPGGIVMVAAATAAAAGAVWAMHAAVSAINEDQAVQEKRNTEVAKTLEGIASGTMSIAAAQARVKAMKEEGADQKEIEDAQRMIVAVREGWNARIAAHVKAIRAGKQSIEAAEQNIAVMKREHAAIEKIKGADVKKRLSGQTEEMSGEDDGRFEAKISSAKQLKKETQDLTEKLKEQLETYGMNAHEAEVYKLKMRGATDAQLAEANAIAKKLDVLKEEKEAQKEQQRLYKEMAKEAEKLAEAVKDPFEKLADQLTTINQLEKAGLLTAIEAELASQKAGDDATKKIEQEAKKREKKIHEPKPFDKLPPAYELRFTRGFQGNNTTQWDKLLKVEERSALAQANIERNTKQLADRRNEVVKI